MAWRTVDEWPEDINSQPWNGYTHRLRVNRSRFPDRNSTKVRITYKAHPEGSGASVTACYIGVAADVGNAYNFASTPAPVTFGGESGFSISAGATIQSDAIDLALDGTLDLLISGQTASGGAGSFAGDDNRSGWQCWYKLAADAAAQSTSGYSVNLVEAVGVVKIEVGAFTPRTLQTNLAVTPDITLLPIIDTGLQLVATVSAAVSTASRRLLVRAISAAAAVEGALIRAFHRAQLSAVTASAVPVRTLGLLRSAAASVAASSAMETARVRILAATVAVAAALRRAVPFALITSVQSLASASKRAVQARLLSAAVAVGAATSRLLARSLSAGATVAAGVSRFLRLARAAGVQATSALRATSARLRPLATGVAAGVVLRTRSVLVQALQAAAIAQASLVHVGLRLMRALVSAGATTSRAFALVRRAGVGARARIARTLTHALEAAVRVAASVLPGIVVIARLLGRALMRPALAGGTALKTALDAAGRMTTRLAGRARAKDD